MAYELDNALFQWEEGHRRLRAASARGEAGNAERLLARVQDELRRRLGPTFSVAELVEMYGRGTEWALDLAPGDLGGLEPGAVSDAAFYEHLRQARDFAGGRIVQHQEDREG